MDDKRGRVVVSDKEYQYKYNGNYGTKMIKINSQKAVNFLIYN